jgi:dihydrofolate reductase/choline kinase
VRGEIIIIAALAENGVIGRDKGLPWSIREDLRRFKELTMGFPCIMGRKTWESLPKRPLAGRLNLVVSRSLTANQNSGGTAGADSETRFFPGLAEALAYCGDFGDFEKIFICGGGSMYQEAIALADKMELTLVRGNWEGDTFFPPIDPAVWTKTAARDFDSFSFVSYSRHKEVIMKEPILVVLAAGMGSRYGGLKQMDRIGKNGEVLLDYSVYDALKSGFGKIVFIIRHDIEKDFRELVLARMGAKVQWDLAFQDPDTLIPPELFAKAQQAGRTKPWGTAHALLCAAEKIDAPFTVLNADDFYGREAFQVMGAYLSAPVVKDAAIVPYRLEKTLSPRGTVTRGVCAIKDGFLVSVDELTAIEKKDGRIFNTGPGGSEQDLSADTPASMNFWGFPETIMPSFKTYFDDFLKTFAADISGNIKGECYLPKAADWFIKNNITRIKSLDADSDWFGVTYKEDRETAVKKIEELSARGVYPASLW